MFLTTHFLFKVEMLRQVYRKARKVTSGYQYVLRLSNALFVSSEKISLSDMLCILYKFVVNNYTSH